MVKKQVKNAEIVIKIERITGYIKKAKRRISLHEKKLARVRAKYEQELKGLSRGLKELKSQLKLKA